MGTAAKPTRENRTITVDFQNETTYFQLLGGGRPSRPEGRGFHTPGWLRCGPCGATPFPPHPERRGSSGVLGGTGLPLFPSAPLGRDDRHRHAPGAWDILSIGRIAHALVDAPIGIRAGHPGPVTPCTPDFLDGQ